MRGFPLRRGRNVILGAAAPLLVSGVVSSARADIAVETDSTTWAAQVAGEAVESLESDALGNHTTPYATAGAWGLASLSSPLTLQVFDNGPINGSRYLHFRDFGAQVRVTPPAGSPVLAFGTRYNTGYEAWQLKINGVVRATLPSYSNGFVGVLASNGETINSIVLTSPSQIQGGISIDDLKIGRKPRMFGLPHAPLGEAELSYDESTREMRLGHIGGTGQDGFTVELGQSGGYAFDYDPPEGLANGASLTMAQIGQLDGGPEQVLTTYSVTYEDGRALHRPDFGPLGSPTYRLQVWNAGAIVVDLPNWSGPGVYTIGPGDPDPGDYNRFGRRKWCIFKECDWLKCPKWLTSPCPGCHPYSLEIPGYGTVESDGFVFTAEMSCPENVVTQMEVRGRNLGEFTVRDVLVKQFHHGHAALGNAVMTAGAQSLGISNLGSTGQDGVSIALDPVAGVGLGLEGFNAGGDAYLSLTARSRNGLDVAGIEAIGQGAASDLVPNFPTPAYSIEGLLAGASRFELASSPTAPPLRIPPAMVTYIDTRLMHEGAGRRASIALSFGAVIAVDHDGNPATPAIAIDTLRFAESADSAADDVAEIELRAADVPSLTIVDEAVHDTCRGDLNRDFQVDLEDLARVLSAFGGGSEGDIDGNGTTELAGLAIVLADFGQMCD